MINSRQWLAIQLLSLRARVEDLHQQFGLLRGHTVVIIQRFRLLWHIAPPCDILYTCRFTGERWATTMFILIILHLASSRRPGRDKLSTEYRRRACACTLWQYTWVRKRFWNLVGIASRRKNYTQKKGTTATERLLERGYIAAPNLIIYTTASFMMIPATLHASCGAYWYAWCS